jgi:hypothetical protein
LPKATPPGLAATPDGVTVPAARQPRPPSVKGRGAAAGRVVRGPGLTNQGSRPPALQERAGGHVGAVGEAPVEVAQRRLEEVFKQLKGVKDTYTTSSHFSVSQPDVAEAVVLAVVERAVSRGGVAFPARSTSWRASGRGRTGAGCR